MPAKFERAPLDGVIVIRPWVFTDDRGFFLESYEQREFQEAGIEPEFVQDNRSCSRNGVLRGLHYQLPPHAQGKLVQVACGRALDVAVDIRAASPTFGRFFTIELDGESCTMVYLPPGFAHGFLALTDDVHLVYKCTTEYRKEAERGVRWNDPQIGIPWPLPTPTLSEKDAALPLLAEAEIFP